MANFMPGEWKLPSLPGLFGLGSDTAPSAPSDDIAAQIQLKRRLAQADFLRNQEMPQGQMVSGHYVAPSWTQYLANLAGKYQSGQQEREAINQYGEFQKGRQAKVADLLLGKEVQRPVDLPSALPGQVETVREPYSQQEFMSRAAEVMPELQDELLKARISQMTKEDTGQVIPAGATYYKGGKAVYTAPTKPDKTSLSEIGKLTAELQDIQAANPNDPRIAWYKDKINKETTFAPPMQVVTMPAPQVAVNPKTLQPELVQFPNRPGMQPQFTGIKPYEKPEKLKPVPAGPATAFTENSTALRKIDDAIAKVEAAPENSFGARNYLGGAVSQRLDPKGVDARAAVSGVGGQKYHDLSGAAVAVQEAARLSPYIPSVTDTKDKILQNLRNLRQEYQYTNDTLQSTFSEDQGYKPLSSQVTRPSAPAENKPKPTLRYNPQTRKLEPM